MKLIKLLTGAFAALALTAAVNAVPIELTYAAAGVGTYTPASEYNNDVEVTQAANAIVNWYNGGANANSVLSGVTVVLAPTSLGALPTPVSFGYKDDSAPFDTFWTSQYMYVMGKFGQTANLYYLGNLTPGEYYLPSSLGPGLGLSHIVLFNARTTSVPDGGVTAALLGLGLVGLSFIARRRKA